MDEDSAICIACDHLVLYHDPDYGCAENSCDCSVFTLGFKYLLAGAFHSVEEQLRVLRGSLNVCVNCAREFYEINGGLYHTFNDDEACFPNHPLAGSLRLKTSHDWNIFNA